MSATEQYTTISSSRDVTGEVPAYLYAHTTIVMRGQGSSHYGLILRTHITSGHLHSIAEYQAARLRASMFAARVWDSLAEATDYLEREYGVRMESM